MPTVYNDRLDDTLSFDGSTKFAGGENSQPDPSQLKKEECAQLINVALNRVGDIQTRKGIDQLGSDLDTTRIQGMVDLDTPTIERILAACNAAMYSWNGSSWSPAAGYTPTNSTVRVRMVQGINLVYVADGIKHLHSWDGTTFTDMGTGGANPPIMHLLVWHTSRLFGVADASDTVYCSAILDTATWDTVNFSFRVGAGEGDNITCIASWSDFNLLCFKHNSIYVVDANPLVSPANWTIKKITDRAGCMSHETAKMVGNDIFFLSRDGIRTVMRTVTEAQSQTSPPISWAIQPIIDRINWAAADTCVAEYVDNKYLLAVPLDGATQPNAVIAIDTRLQVALGVWTGAGWTPTAMLFSKLGDDQRFFFGNTVGQVQEWLFDGDEGLNSVYTDNGSDIATTVKTGSYTFSEMISPKIGWNVELEFNQSLATATLSAVLDQNSGSQVIAAAFPTYGSTNQLPVTLPFDLAVLTIWRRGFDLAALGEFREIQFVLTTSSGKLGLKQILASAYINTMRYES